MGADDAIAWGCVALVLLGFAFHAWCNRRVERVKREQAAFWYKSLKEGRMTPEEVRKWEGPSKKTAACEPRKWMTAIQFGDKAELREIEWRTCSTLIVDQNEAFNKRFLTRPLYEE